MMQVPERPRQAWRRVHEAARRQRNVIAAPRFSALTSRFRREEWNIGVVPQTIGDIVRHGITKPIEWWPDRGPWRMLADPSILVDPDGRRILFAEHLDHRIGRGEIWGARLAAGETLSKAVLRPWMRSSAHLSYPQPVFDTNGCMYFMAETWQAGALHLWRRMDDSLAHVGPIIPEPLLDPTPWHDGTTWWLFCTSRFVGSNQQLRLYYADRLEGPWTAHPRNPVKSDPASSRPAGPIVRVDGDLIRPAQDCSETYGGGIVLNRIMRLDRDCFEEAPIRRLQADTVYPHGLHTLCSAGDLTLVDGKRLSFRSWDIPRKIFVAGADWMRPMLKPSLPARLPLPA
nr:hypothetical protein [uncultured Rhodopila sp.]